ncbi:hypothetical protein C9J01_16725 [Photobacterium rosenbergii]|uniref:Uncharacterized protein n=1 Tax=Photobacterium rosenbergii TaxID=294936 RepID=A0A2T3NB71_9GAMM|nr:hypothetical protein C9J01_16725 [Photobacterium rosenbergii]
MKLQFFASRSKIVTIFAKSAALGRRFLFIGRTVLWSWVLGSGFWVLGSGFWVLGSGFWVLGSGFWVLQAAFVYRYDTSSTCFCFS